MNIDCAAVSTSMGCFFSKPKTVASVPTLENPQSLQSTSIPRTTLTPPSISGMATNTREALHCRNALTMTVGTTLHHPSVVIHLATSRSPGNAFRGPIYVQWNRSYAADQIYADGCDSFAERTIAYAYLKEYPQTHRPYKDGQNQLPDVQILARWIASEAICCLVTP